MPIRPISSARFFSRFTRGENMFNQISRIRVTAKKKFATRANVFSMLFCFVFFYARLFPVYKMKSVWSDQSIYAVNVKWGVKGIFFCNVSAVCVSAFQEPLYEAL